ncbi:hypothetical protein QR680_017442 [Steinernema hermaphroditum]|uniref:Uncharacterized protein n=1 Tax=Steinernema hermaphroditum TaxID=289476 RepID=A0AA39HGR3_9BILA|nr:hypothetical protein QR680_017442 [Steinernema hermaphroditum]
MGSPFFVLVATVLALSAGTQQIPQTVSVQQCRCADINKCNARIAARTEDCKRVEFLRKIGDEAKIRGCLEAEQTEVQRMEDCVRSRVGTVGCSTEMRPGNLSVPLIP